jgi:hypothetical protein
LAWKAPIEDGVVFFADDGVRSCHKLVIAGPNLAIREVFPLVEAHYGCAGVKPAHDK